MLEEDLSYAIAWEWASFEERQALIDAASAVADAPPAFPCPKRGAGFRIRRPAETLGLAASLMLSK